ncbi:putative glutaredoxin Grx1 [Blastocladiella britannica]|nr:putative glutaredoxin Grx1 [Blastocladiella britannica]
MSARIADLVKTLVAENFVMVFSKSYCPYCTKAKNTLSANGQKFKAVELDKEADGPAIQQHLADLTGQRTVPNIFIDGKHIGGCSDLLDLQSS